MNPTPSFRLGHVLIKVTDLKKAVHDFEQLGFTVTYGSTPKKAKNAMIYFKDGSFLELFCMNFGQPINSVLKCVVKGMKFFRNPSADRYNNYIHSQEGFSDYALDSFPSSLFVENIQSLLETGLHVVGPKKMKRTNLDGINLQWSLYCPIDWKLPFFMSPYHPVVKIDEEKVTHPNGSHGFLEIKVSTTSWQETLQTYCNIYRQHPHVEKQDGGMSCKFQVDATSIILVEGKRDGITQVVLKGDSSSPSGQLTPSLCHGAALSIAETS